MISPFLQVSPRTAREARMDSMVSHLSRAMQLYRNALSDEEALELLQTAVDWLERGLHGRTMHTVEGDKLVYGETFEGLKFHGGLLDYIEGIRSDIQWWQDKLAEKEAVE